MLPICECMIFDDDELFGDVLYNANMIRWYIYLDVDKLWRCGLYANFDER